MNRDIQDILSLLAGFSAVLCTVVIVLHYFPIKECTNHDDTHEFNSPSPTGFFMVSLPITTLRSSS